MEPTLPEGCSILVDGTRRRWRQGRIFVFLTGDGLIVKRADEAETGRRLLASDHPAWAPIALPDDASILGEVAWTARTLRGMIGPPNASREAGAGYPISDSNESTV